MQESLFIPEPFMRQEGQVNRSFGQSFITEADIRNLQLEEAEYTRWYCIKEILCEQYLWDMRCWDKPKCQYTKEEIIEHIRKWINDHEEGNWTNNCGHCLFCIRRLLDRKEATMEEIADLVKRNNNIKYYNQIKTWNNGFEEEKGV
jgi:hypothetical protein